MKRGWAFRAGWNPLATVRTGLIVWATALNALPTLADEPWASVHGFTIPDSILACTPAAAYEHGLHLSVNRRALSSLPWFQRALMDSALGGDVHLAYAGALYQAAFEVIDCLGVSGPRQSVSARRIELLREAIAQLDTAEREANDPRTVAMIRYRHGEILEVWGVPLDAYGWYRGGLAADSSCLDATLGLSRVMTRLQGNGQAPPEARRR